VPGALVEMHVLKTKNYRTFDLDGVVIEGAASVAPALPGDIVTVAEGKVTSVEFRDNHKSLVGILEVASKTRYGFTKRNAPIYLFIPWNESYPPFYVGSTHADTSKNVIAVVDFEDWDAGQNLPRGSCRQILGYCGDLATEELGLLIHACPSPWKSKGLPAVLERGRPAPNRVKGTTFHIDPPGCRDVDDAISMWKVSDTCWEVHIHIADVASIIAANGWLQLKALALGQSLYKDGAVIAGMLPLVAEEACSLLPFEPRSTLTLAFRWSSEDGIGQPWWLHEEVQIAESYTYESIYGSAHAPTLEAIASSLKGSHTADSHEWIEEFMLFYNRQAAAVLREAGVGILRRHGPPDMARLAELERLGEVPTYLAFQAGEYCSALETDVKHWGLGAGLYCHATSPIRRWADCINQTYLMNILFGYGLDPLLGCADHLNLQAAKAKAYERDLFFVRTILGNTAWRVVEGIVLSKTDVGLKLWVPAWKRLVNAKPPIDGWYMIIEPGQKVKASIYYEVNQRCWKKRMVISVNLPGTAATP
jgi:exoribonuclease R